MNKDTNELFLEIIKNKDTICVFDLDSTLFNVSPRSQKILHEFAVEHNHQTLLDINIDLTDWGVFEPLKRHGYNMESHSDLYQELKKSWTQKFFSNEYLHFDTPYPGAISFVQKLVNHQISIQYLTGRDVFRMSQGTQAVLKKWGFPYHSDQIHLKPKKEMDDEYFKLDWISNLKKNHQNSQIYLFENEPVNLNLIGKRMPEIQLVFMNTTHSRQESVTVSHLEISNFNLNSNITESSSCYTS